MLPVNDPTLRRTGRQILLYSAALFPVSLLPVMAGVAGRSLHRIRGVCWA